MSLAGEANTGAIPSDGLEGTLRVTQWAQQNQKSGASMHALALAFSPGSLTGRTWWELVGRWVSRRAAWGWGHEEGRGGKGRQPPLVSSAPKPNT